jgi:tRNA dimethylallyltransferase
MLGDAEIVSVDSMQVYRRMDIGTGKATPAERSSVPHHLLDIVEPSEDFSVAWFQAEASSVLDDLADRRRRAILVGGTGLYHRAVIDGLDIPGEYPAVRHQLEAEIEGGVPVASLHRRLADLDPDAAGRTEPTNARRIVRALEVTLGARRPFSSFGPGLEEYPPSDHLLVGLHVDRSTMRPLIERRVHQMMDAGFLDEVRSLLAEPDGLSRTARQALGYRELVAHLTEGTPLADAVAETVVRTRQFAVRQDRWFRRDPRIEWHEAPSGDSAGFPSQTRSLALRIADKLGAR